MLPPGTQIGRYEIQRKLARGGMGVVYVAHDPVLGRMVAIKVFLGDLDVPDAAERFAREARAAASLNHAHIVTVYDFGEVASQPYIVMEYIQGETLAEFIRRRTSVPIPEKLRWLEELCAGVASAHKMDVVHRDIKPSNLMIDRTGRLKILDFGIAKIVNSLGTSMTAVIGTPGYMAPEQLLGHAVDARTDIFSIGVVGFELLTYEEAFAGDSFTAVSHRIINEGVRPLAELVPDAPPDLCTLIERCLHKNPADRFPDAESLRIGLSRVRRQMETTPDFDPSSAHTIIGTMALPIRKIGTGTSGKPGTVGVRTAELTPPPDPSVQREAVARARAAQVKTSLELAQACLEAGDLDKALEACKQAQALDNTNKGALDLEHAIAVAAARQRAAALLADARTELARGALTRCRTLLEEARKVDPEAHDATLERDLRLARVEQERLRHRSETIAKTIASAREALETGDIEAALAWAREALDLDPSSVEARALELEATRRLEEDTSLPTVQYSAEDVAELETTVIALPQAPILPGRQTAAPPPVQHTPAPPPPPPPLVQTPAPTIQPAARQAATPVPQPTVQPPVPQPVVEPPTVVATPVPLPTTPARVPVAKPAASPPPVVSGARPDPFALVRPLLPSMASARALAARARALPRRSLLIAAVAAVALLLGAALVGYLMRRTPAAVPTGALVIEALPWAEVTAIKSADGTNHLAAPSSTPFVSQSLPVGSYTVELTGPPPASEKRTVTVEVGGGGVTLAPPARFAAPTMEQYFGRYFGGTTAAAATGGAPDPVNPAGEPGAQPADGAAPPATPSSPPAGVVP